MFIQMHPVERRVSRRVMLTMPTYYIHLRDRSGDAVDVEGIQLPNPDAARAMALESARDLIATEAKAGEIDMSSTIQVDGSLGEMIHLLHFYDAVRIKY